MIRSENGSAKSDENNHPKRKIEILDNVLLKKSRQEEEADLLYASAEQLPEDDEDDDEFSTYPISEPPPDEPTDIEEKIKEMDEISLKSLPKGEATTSKKPDTDDDSLTEARKEINRGKITNLRKNIKDIMDENQLDAGKYHKH